MLILSRVFIVNSMCCFQLGGGGSTGIFHKYRKAVSILRGKKGIILQIFFFQSHNYYFQTVALLSVIVGCMCIDSWTNLCFQKVFNEHSKLNGGSCDDDDNDG